MIDDALCIQNHGVRRLCGDLLLEFGDGGRQYRAGKEVFGEAIDVFRVVLGDVVGGGLDGVGKDGLLHGVQLAHVEMLGVELVLLLVQPAFFVVAFQLRDFLEDDGDSGLAREVLHLLDVVLALLFRDEVHVDADLGYVAQGHDRPLDLRLDVFRAVEGEFRSPALALFEGGASERVAGDVAELRQERLDVVVGRHGLAGVFGVAEAGVDEAEKGLFAVPHSVGVVPLQDVLDGVWQVARQAVAGVDFLELLERVEELVEVLALLRIGFEERDPELVGDAICTAEKAVEVGAAVRVNLQWRRKEGVDEGVGGAPSDFRLEDDDGVAVNGRAAVVDVLDVEGAIDGALVGVDVVLGELGEEDLLDAVALVEVARALGVDVLVVQVPDVREGLGRVGEDRRFAREDVERDVNRQLRRAQHVAHLLELDVAEAARVEFRPLGRGDVLALCRALGRDFGQDGHVRGRDVLFMDWLGDDVIDPGGAVFVRELLRKPEVFVLERLVGGVGSAKVGEVREGGAVADLLQDERLEVEEPRGGDARVPGRRIDLPLAHERGLEQVHLG